MLENRLEIYNFCKEYIRLVDFHRCLWDIEKLDNEYNMKIQEELDILEDCIYDEIVLNRKIKKEG